MIDRIELDQVDFQILRILQENARMSNADLARELGMAPSGVLERVRKLEQKGAIEGYEVKINPAYVGQNLLAFISVKTSDIFGSDATGKALAKIPEIQEVHNITGEFCFLVKARVADSAALMDLMRNHMAKIKTIASTETIMVLETVKDSQKMIIP